MLRRLIQTCLKFWNFSQVFGEFCFSDIIPEELAKLIDQAAVLLYIAFLRILRAFFNVSAFTTKVENADIMTENVLFKRFTHFPGIF